MVSIADGGGPMNTAPASATASREGGVLGEEPVPGVDRIGAAAGEHAQDEVYGEVALGCRLASESVGLVCHTNVKGVLVELGVDGDRSDAELAAGPDDPHGDLAAVGDEHLVEHRSPFSTY